MAGADNYWVSACHGNSSSSVIPTGQACKPLSRINGTGFTDWQCLPRRTFLSILSPFRSDHRNVWRIRYTSTFAATHHNNGDGSLIYPGADGPLGSLRLAAMVDGIEDWNLFRRLGLTVNDSDGGPGSTAQPGRIW